MTDRKSLSGLLRLLAIGSCIFTAQAASAGVFILDGTDADDHGFASGGVNQEGWSYIQRGLENIASSSALTRTQKTIAVLGSDAGNQAAQAIQSAVSLSSALTSTGWSVVLLNGSQIADFFSNTGSGLHSSAASVIYMDSTSNNVSGGLNSAEQGIIDANATGINDFLGAGGGLFSHSQGYGWLSTLVSGLTVVDESDTGILLTAAGQASFPGLTDADLSAGPYHNTFAGVGGIPVLGVGSAGTSLAGRAVILGGAGGTITQPPVPVVPEPATWAMMLVGFGMIGASARYHRRARKIGYA